MKKTFLILTFAILTTIFLTALVNADAITYDTSQPWKYNLSDAGKQGGVITINKIDADTYKNITKVCVSPNSTGTNILIYNHLCTLLTNTTIGADRCAYPNASVVIFQKVYIYETSNGAPYTFQGVVAATSHYWNYTQFNMSYGTTSPGSCADEVQSWYNIQNITFGFSNATSLIFVDNTPANGTHNNTQVQINASCGSPGFTYSIYFDNNTNPTTLVVDNSTSGQYNTSVTTDGAYYFKGFCTNSTSGVKSANSSIYTWFYDATFPTININTNNLFTINNESYNAYNTTKILNLTFTDNILLYAYYVNITKDGTIYFNKTNQSLGGSYTILNYSTSIDASKWAEGIYHAEVLASDAHTAKAISNYQITSKKSFIQFKTPNGNNIKVETNEPASITANKTIDRYTFKVNYDDGLTKSRIIEVKSECKLDYLPYSPYKAHFVSFCNNDGNWLDFEGSSNIPFVTKIDDYHYQVYFVLLAPSITFNSIGGLNIYNANFTFYVGNYTFTNQTYVINTPYNYILNLTNATGQNINAQLYYDGVNITGVEKTIGSNFIAFNVSKTTNNIGLHNFTWIVDVNQAVYDYSFNISSSQSLLAYSLTATTGDCGAGYDEAYIFRFFDENNIASPLLSYYEYTFTYSTLIGMSLNQNLSSSATSRNFTICLYPQNTTMYVDAYIKYNVTDGFSHRYFLVNNTANAVTQSFSLYNTDNTTDYSVLKLTTRRGEDYSYYKNVIGSLQKYYVNEGVWRTIQMDESGEYGVMNFDIREKSVDYRISFMERNTTNLLKITQGMKFVCTSALCDLTYLLMASQGVSSADTYIYNITNSSKIINVSWSDTGLAAVSTRLYVWKSTITGVSNICDTTQNGNAGTMGCNATAYSGNIIVQIYTDGNLKATRNYQFSDNNLGYYLPDGEGGFWAMLIVVLCVLFGLFSPVGSIITGIVGLVIVYMLGIFNPLTFTAIAVASIIGAIIGFKVKA